MNQTFSILWGTRHIKGPQLSVYVACAMKQLRGMGVKSADRVAICDENSIEYVILILALWQMKAVVAPVSPRWPKKVAAAYGARIGARLFLRGEVIKKVVCYDARQNLEASASKPLDLEQEVTIIATSGSGGEPKAALHTWANHMYSAKGSQVRIPLSATDRWLLSLPLYHISGMAILVRCLLSGAVLVIQDGDLSAALAMSKVTHVSVVSTQLQRLLERQDGESLLRGLKCILLGGSGIPPALLKECARAGLNACVSYGLTETSSQVATGPVSAAARGCAQVLPYRDVKISSEGEILVRGEVLFKGYIQGGRLKRPMIDSADGGWFATGDVGSLDPQGCLTVSGRLDNMFISGGENIYPEEIEKVLMDVPGVALAVVVGRPDKDFGHRPAAFIQFSGPPLAEAQLVRRLETELPRFKIPAEFHPWPQHLASGGIKISRREFLSVLSGQ